MGKIGVIGDISDLMIFDSFRRRRCLRNRNKLKPIKSKIATPAMDAPAITPVRVDLCVELAGGRDEPLLDALAPDVFVAPAEKTTNESISMNGPVLSLCTFETVKLCWPSARLSAQYNNTPGRTART